jgi:hypothetical protein
MTILLLTGNRSDGMLVARTEDAEAVSFRA